MAMSIQPEFSPGAPGGVCFVCKSARRQGDAVVDFYVDPEDLNWVVPTTIPGMAFELATGSLEVCQTCIVEAASGFGMVSAQQAEQMELAHDKLAAALADAQDRAEVAEKALKSLMLVDPARLVGNKVFGEDTE